MRAPRLTVVETVYRQEPGASPALWQTRFSRQLTVEDEPYERRLTLGGAWVPLAQGAWLKSASQLCLANLERGEGKVVEVAVAPEGGEPAVFALLLPGGPDPEGLRLRPADLSRLVARCRQGEAQVRLFLTPE